MNIVGSNAAWGVTVFLAVHFSSAQFSTAETIASRSAKTPASESISLVRQTPETIKQLDPGTLQFDFGKVAFGNLELTSPAGFEGAITVRFGEKRLDGLIDREPPGKPEPLLGRIRQLAQV